MMDEVERMVRRINDEYARFRATGTEPTHFILGIEARQALKMAAHPFADPPLPGVTSYHGVPIIDLEKVIIVGPEGS